MYQTWHDTVVAVVATLIIPPLSLLPFRRGENVVEEKVIEEKVVEAICPLRRGDGCTAKRRPLLQPLDTVYILCCTCMRSQPTSTQITQFTFHANIFI